MVFGVWKGCLTDGYLFNSLSGGIVKAWREKREGFTNRVLCRCGSYLGLWDGAVMYNQPGMYESWGKAAKSLGGFALIGLLFWVAIYELVKW